MSKRRTIVLTAVRISWSANERPMQLPGPAGMSATVIRQAELVQRTIVEGHICALVELELLSTSFRNLRAFVWKPALRPEAMRFREEISRVAMHLSQDQQ